MSRTVYSSRNKGSMSSGPFDQVDGALLCSASYDQTIKIWSLTTGKLTGGFNHNEGQVNALSLTSSGRDLAVGAWQRVRIYDVLAAKDPKATIDLPKNVTVVGFEAQGRWMYTGGDDGVCRIWEMRSNQLVANRLLGFAPSQITSIAVNMNQTDLFVSTSAGQVWVWDVVNHMYMRLPMPEKLTLLECVQKLAIHPSGKKLTGITNKGRLLCWDLMTRQVEHVSFDMYKSPIIPVEQDTGTHGELQDEDKVYKLPRGYGISCRYSPDGKYLVACGSDAEIHVLNAESMTHTCTLNANCDWNWDAIFSSDGKYIFSGGGDGRMKIWNVMTARMESQFDGHSKPITAICINSTPR